MLRKLLRAMWCSQHHQQWMQASAKLGVIVDVPRSMPSGLLQGALPYVVLLLPLTVTSQCSAQHTYNTATPSCFDRVVASSPASTSRGAYCGVDMRSWDHDLRAQVY